MRPGRLISNPVSVARFAGILARSASDTILRSAYGETMAVIGIQTRTLRSVSAGYGARAEPNWTENPERGRFEQPDRTAKPAWAHPVLASGKLCFRDLDTLFYYDFKAK